MGKVSFNNFVSAIAITVVHTSGLGNMNIERNFRNAEKDVAQ